MPVSTPAGAFMATVPSFATAVLLFSLPDSVESGRKKVTRQAGAVWRTMRELTEEKVHASGLTLLRSHRLIDHQGTFGEQLSAALSAAFAQGYERIICIGNDCPDLLVTDLRRAATALANNRLPIGADRRGGVYLAGFSRDQFRAHALAQLPWQTHQLAQALRRYVAAQGITTAELPIRTDVNQRIDATAVRWLGQPASRLLTTLKQALLSVAPVRSTTLPTLFSACCHYPVTGRAPPCA